MVELGEYYVKNKETNEILKVQLMSKKFVNLKQITLASIIKSFLADLKFYFFKKDTQLNSDTINEAIRKMIISVYDDYNKNCNEETEEKVDYAKEIFKEEPKIPRYVG